MHVRFLIPLGLFVNLPINGIDVSCLRDQAICYHIKDAVLLPPDFCMYSIY